MENIKIQKESEQEQYIIALKGTVVDLKSALYTITMIDDIDEVHKIAHEMLNDFYNADKFTKKTILQKEQDLLKCNEIMDHEGKLIIDKTKA